MSKKDDREEGFRRVAAFMTRKEWNGLCDEVDAGIRESKVAYIGRTNDPELRREEHHETWGAERLDPVFSSRDRQQIEAVETALIIAADRFARLKNKTYESVGRYGRGRNSVYLASTKRGQVKRSR